MYRCTVTSSIWHATLVIDDGVARRPPRALALLHWWELERTCARTTQVVLTQIHSGSHQWSSASTQVACTPRYIGSSLIKGLPVSRVPSHQDPGFGILQSLPLHPVFRPSHPTPNPLLHTTSHITPPPLPWTTSCSTPPEPPSPLPKPQVVCSRAC